MSPPPKDHHFVPRFILEKFTDSAGFLHFWRRNKPAGKVFRAVPKELFFAKFLYSYDAGDAKDHSLETFFANEIEGPAAPLIDTICSNARRKVDPALSPDDWELWHKFIYYQIKRTPRYMDWAAERIGLDEQLLKNAETFRPGAASMIKADPALNRRMSRNAKIEAQRLPPSEEVQRAAENLGLAVYVIEEPTKSFVVGDAPVAFAFGSPKGQERQTFMFLPVARDVALGFSNYRRQVSRLTIGRDLIRTMNEATAARSGLIAGQSPQLISSLSKFAASREVADPGLDA